MSGTWASDWSTGDVVTAAEFRKSLGCVADSTLGAPAASFDFTGLPTTYAHLLVVAYLRTDTGSAQNVSVRMNNDSAANYNYQEGLFTNGSASEGQGLAQTAIRTGYTAGVTDTANRFSSHEIFLPNYANTSNHKSIDSRFSVSISDLAAGQYAGVGGGTWKSAAAINRITILPQAGNFVAGSRCSIYVMGS